MACAPSDTQCSKDNAVKVDNILKANKFLASLQKNIQTLEEYKKLPQKLNDLLGKKEERLQQILCNIETISKLT